MAEFFRAVARRVTLAAGPWQFFLIALIAIALWAVSGMVQRTVPAACSSSVVGVGGSPDRGRSAMHIGRITRWAAAPGGPSRPEPLR